MPLFVFILPENGPPIIFASSLGSLCNPSSTFFS